MKQCASRGDKVYGTVRSRQNSGGQTDLISGLEAQFPGRICVLEGFSLNDDGVIESLKSCDKLQDVTFDLVIHNAGSMNGTRAFKGSDAGNFLPRTLLEDVHLLD